MECARPRFSCGAGIRTDERATVTAMEVDPASDFTSLSIQDVLDADPRPTFALDLDLDLDTDTETLADRAEGEKPTTLRPVFRNAALRSHPTLCESTGPLFDYLRPPSTRPASSDGTRSGEGKHVRDEQPSPPTGGRGANFDDFRRWATGRGLALAPSFLYRDVCWTASTVHGRWRLISGTKIWKEDHFVSDRARKRARRASVASVAPKEETRTQQEKVDWTTSESAASANCDDLETLQHGNEDVLSDQPSPAFASSSSTTSSPPIGSSTPLESPNGPLFPLMTKLGQLPVQDPTQPLLSGTTAPTPLSPSRPHYPRSFFHEHMRSGTSDGGSSDTAAGPSVGSKIPLSAPERAVADWTVPKPAGILSPHVNLVRSVDWAKTPLGPMETWSPEFRQTANLCMANPHPAALFWGSELTMMYNEAYAAEVAGTKHPSLMGTGFSGPFSELWEYLNPVFAECARTGVSVRKENDYLPINRRGMLEETFYTWSFTPLYGGTDTILGFYNAPFDVTVQVLNQRWMETINQLGATTAHAKTVKQFWKLVLDALHRNYFDVPFALLYSLARPPPEAVEDDGSDSDRQSQQQRSSSSSRPSSSTLSSSLRSSSSSTTGTATPTATHTNSFPLHTSCYLEGTIAVPAGHPSAPPCLDLALSSEGFVPAFREAMRTRVPRHLRAQDGTLPEALLEGIAWRGFGQPCTEAIILPVRPTNRDVVLAFLVLGVNPRRPFDDAYKSFVGMVNRQLATSLASVLLYEDEVERSRNMAEMAAMEKERLTAQLALQADRMRRMTELSPLGMFLVGPDGVLREGNDRFFEMTGHPRDNLQYEMSWTDFIMPGSKATMAAGWRRLVDDLHPWQGELQLHTPASSAGGPVNMHGERIDYWVQFNAQSEVAADDGSLRAVMCSITDISHLKWAQGLQQRQLQEAEETRRQQNEFIDITSHEMRNPLSAILQCADDIFAALETPPLPPLPPTPMPTSPAIPLNGNSSGVAAAPSADVIASCIEAAQTIALCVQHQKSIVDDILTISKLDSNLLLITPVPSQPAVVLRRAVKMFDSELQAKEIELVFHQDQSYAQLAMDWVMLDPSRVLQVLINLMTNAIKFTAPAEKRVIRVAVGASLSPPLTEGTASLIPGFQYAETKAAAAAAGPGGLGVVSPGSYTSFDSEDWGYGEMVYVTFQVEDTGCGLTPEEKQILFQRFKQASPRTHAQYGGSGLGLFISKRLAELHGGQIGVASQSGRGSVFAFFVRARRTPAPVGNTAVVDEDGGGDTSQRVHEKERPPIERQLSGGDLSLAALDVAPQPQEMAGSSPAASLVAQKHMKGQICRVDPRETFILVVEDNLINQRVLVKQLRKTGCTVYTANDGLEALSFLDKSSFAPGAQGGCPLTMALMDLEMPNMDGLSCIAEIRRREADGRLVRHVPVIAVTANVRGEQVTQAKEAGMDDVVFKPFRIPDLFKKIDALLLGPPPKEA